MRLLTLLVPNQTFRLIAVFNFYAESQTSSLKKFDETARYPVEVLRLFVDYLDYIHGKVSGTG
jgi:hypothetical protein